MHLSPLILSIAVWNSKGLSRLLATSEVGNIHAVKKLIKHKSKFRFSVASGPRVNLMALQINLVVSTYKILSIFANLHDANIYLGS